MAEASLIAPSAKAEVQAAIRDIEALTCAEVVVALRPRSGVYRDTDWLVGLAFAYAALLVFLFHPVEFSIDWMPLDTLAAFALGAALSANVAPLRRALTSKKRMRRCVLVEARSTFVELQIARTAARTGVLVYVSLFERRAETVLDVGLDRVVLGPAFDAALQALDGAVRARAPLPSLTAALRALGPLLAAAMPRHAEDVNELPDELDA